MKIIQIINRLKNFLLKYLIIVKIIYFRNKINYVICEKNRKERKGRGLEFIEILRDLK